MSHYGVVIDGVKELIDFEVFVTLGEKRLGEFSHDVVAVTLVLQVFGHYV